MEESRTSQAADTARQPPGPEIRGELESSLGSRHSVARPLDQVLETFTYDQQLFEVPRAARRRRMRQSGPSLPGFAGQASLEAPAFDPWRATRPFLWRLRWGPVLVSAAVLILLGTLVQKASHLLYRQPTMPAIDLIIGQELAAKVPLIQRELAAGRLEVRPKRPVGPARIVPRPVSVLPASLNPMFRRYHIHRGDTMRDLAKRFDLTEHTIRQLNRLPRNLPQLKPGGLLYVPANDGLLHPVGYYETLGDLAIRYNVPLARIRYFNPHLQPKLVRVGQQVFVPGATRVLFRPRPRLGTGLRRVRTVMVGRKRTLSYVDTERLTWPARGEYSSEFGWRWGGFHSGIDIANDYGTTIRAAAEGNVVSADWEGGYGYTVDIRHGNGMVTRYAHCAQMYVTPGQHVDRGQAIASMGSTGNATGPHVHFEVRLNGEAVNPRSYLN